MRMHDIRHALICLRQLTVWTYRIAENVGGRKLWRIQLFRLFGGENFGEWPLPCAAD